MKISYSARTTASSVSPMENQDYFVIDESYWTEDTGYLFVVADGIKSWSDDCHVAKLGAESVYSRYYTNISDNRTVMLEKAFEYANQQILKACPNLGTTCTAALFHGETLHVANVGNSRAYYFRENHLRQITRDHSMAAAFIQMEYGSEDDLRKYHHSLYKPTRWLGSKSALDVDIFSENPEPKDSILLCTKGLSGWLHDEDARIAEVLKIHSVENAAEALMKLVEEAGVYMDTTAIVISFE